MIERCCANPQSGGSVHVFVETAECNASAIVDIAVNKICCFLDKTEVAVCLQACVDIRPQHSLTRPLPNTLEWLSDSADSNILSCNGCWV